METQKDDGVRSPRPWPGPAALRTRSVATGYAAGDVDEPELLDPESLDGALQSEESAVRWLNDLLDVDHKGLNAVSFAIACLTLAGVLGWALYTAYGLAAMPFDWLRGKQSPSEQRHDVEMSIASIREASLLVAVGGIRVTGEE
ncbi:lmbrd1 [Symbiodinium natans]|uniref:Lmbrd1 protein n=1 Tax=Symbiodinium natans TaxID=878477 RepID=A0A812PJQ2_9DINO|nr:lmbrd1 [Symbiodinium natans]